MVHLLGIAGFAAQDELLAEFRPSGVQLQPAEAVLALESRYGSVTSQTFVRRALPSGPSTWSVTTN